MRMGRVRLFAICQQKVVIADDLRIVVSRIIERRLFISVFVCFDFRYCCCRSARANFAI